MTIFDLSFRHHPDHFSRSWVTLMNFLVPRTARRAAAVIAISEFARREIIETYGLPPDRVHLTHLAADTDAYSPHAAPGDPSVLSRRGIRAPYILHVGTLNRRKNIPTLLRALRQLLDAGRAREVQLVLVGGEERGMPGRDEVARLTIELGLQQQVLLTGYLPADEMPAIYRGAQLLAQPSLYEGFGLPVVEAMASGTPVVVSRGGSLPEIAGDAALQFDAGSAEELAEAIGRLLEDGDLRDGLAAAAIERARGFSWRDTARQTLRVYEAVV